jgi:hypothetical protein
MLKLLLPNDDITCATVLLRHTFTNIWSITSAKDTQGFSQHNNHNFSVQEAFDTIHHSTMKSVYVSILFSLFATGVCSFNVAPSSISTTTTSRSVVVVASSRAINEEYVGDDASDSQYAVLLNRARQYAYSDTTTAYQAKQSLRFLLELQSDCVTGTVMEQNLCDNITELVDVVAHLRQKANQQSAIMLAR